MKLGNSGKSSDPSGTLPLVSNRAQQPKVIKVLLGVRDGIIYGGGRGGLDVLPQTMRAEQRNACPKEGNSRGFAAARASCVKPKEVQL